MCSRAATYSTPHLPLLRWLARCSSAELQPRDAPGVCGWRSWRQESLACPYERRRQPGVQRPPALVPQDSSRRVPHATVQRQRPPHAVLHCGPQAGPPSPLSCPELPICEKRDVHRRLPCHAVEAVWPWTCGLCSAADSARAQLPASGSCAATVAWDGTGCWVLSGRARRDQRQPRPLESMGTASAEVCSMLTLQSRLQDVQRVQHHHRRQPRRAARHHSLPASHSPNTGSQFRRSARFAIVYCKERWRLRERVDRPPQATPPACAVGRWMSMSCAAVAPSQAVLGGLLRHRKTDWGCEPRRFTLRLCRPFVDVPIAVQGLQPRSCFGC